MTKGTNHLDVLRLRAKITHFAGMCTPSVCSCKVGPACGKECREAELTWRVLQPCAAASPSAGQRRPCPQAAHWSCYGT